MDFFTLAQERYSVRKFSSQPVEDGKLHSILEFGRLAPTAKNEQPQKLLVIQQEEGLLKLKKAAMVYGAPVAVIACADMRQSWKRPFDGMDSADIDVSIITTYMMLEATRQGLGTIWVCYFNPDILRQEFALPDYIRPVNILGIGYPAADAEPSERHGSRKPLAETVAYDTHNW